MCEAAKAPIGQSSLLPLPAFSRVFECMFVCVGVGTPNRDVAYVRKAHEFESKSLRLVVDAEQAIDMKITKEKRKIAEIETQAHRVTPPSLSLSESRSSA